MTSLLLLAIAAAPLALAASGAAGRPLPGRPGGEDLVGRPAPPLGLKAWVNSPPIDLPDLRGKVVLVRWWTDTCPFCEASAPALNELDRRYRDRGLAVIGVFHPKPPGDRSLQRARRAGERFGFAFPVALDADWRALRAWWLDSRPPGAWTSITFLLDRQGIIRLVHPGGEFHEGPGGGHWPDHASCREEFRAIEETIVALLGE